MARRAALLIGCDQYSDPELPALHSPAADVRTLSELLLDPDVGRFDEVRSLPGEHSGVSHQEMAAAIEAFFRGRTADDFLLLYYGGHGIQGAGGELIFCARDTFVANRHATGVAATWVRDRIAESRSSRILVLLDCCFSGAFPAGLRPRAHQEVRPLADVQGRGRVVITASTATEFAFEEGGSGHDGRAPRSAVFTATVIAGIETGLADRDGDGRVSVTDLYRYVYREVAAWGHQTPTMRGEIAGELYVSYRGQAHLSELTGGLGPPRVDLVPRPRPAHPLEIIRTKVVLAPRLRADIPSATVRRWLCPVGQRVHHDTPLLEIQYLDNGQSRTLEVTATVEGVLRGLPVLEGERIVGQSALGVVALGVASNGVVAQRPPQLAPKAGIVRLMPVTLPKPEHSPPMTVLAWWRTIGERVEIGQPLLQVRAGQAALDVTSSVGGTLRATALMVGETAASGAVVAVVSID